MRNAMFIIFLQQILDDKLLLIVSGEEENNLSGAFRLKPRICCEIVVKNCGHNTSLHILMLIIFLM